MFSMPEHSENFTGLGWKLREIWRITEESTLPLVKWFQVRGIKHPKDMSNLILIAFTYQNLGRKWDLKPHVQRMLDQWKRYGWAEDGSCSLENMRPQYYEPMECGLLHGQWD